MKKFSKHTPEHTVVKLDKTRSMKATGSTVAEVCRDLGVSEATYRRWVKQYGDMSRSEARRFKELQEDAKLKRLPGETELEKALLKELAEKKILTPAHRYEAIDYALSVGYSVHCACRVAGVSKAAYYNARKRHQQPSMNKYTALRSWLVTFTGEHRRWGYRRAWVKARQAGFTCGRDVVRRLWHQEGLRVFPRTTP